MRPAIVLLALSLTAAALAAACDDGDAPAATDGTPPAVEPTREPTPPVAGDGDRTVLPTAGPTEEALAPVQAAITDLAQRFEREASDVEVLSVSQREWPDACLGVTYVGEDVACAQVITPGYQVILRLGATVYRYRTDLSGDIVRFGGLGLE